MTDNNTDDTWYFPATPETALDSESVVFQDLRASDYDYKGALAEARRVVEGLAVDAKLREAYTLSTFEHILAVWRSENEVIAHHRVCQVEKLTGLGTWLRGWWPAKEKESGE